MTDMMPTPSPPRLAKFGVPTTIALISRTRAGGTVFVIVVAVLALAVLRSRPSSPKQLGKREPIVRRTDLGAKGIYYRATVVPFAPDRNTRERH